LTHNNLALALAIAPDAPQRPIAEALEHARKAIELAPENCATNNTLALAEYRSGSWSEALAASEQSMKL